MVACVASCEHANPPCGLGFGKGCGPRTVLGSTMRFRLVTRGHSGTYDMWALLRAPTVHSLFTVFMFRFSCGIFKDKQQTIVNNKNDVPKCKHTTKKPRNTNIRKSNIQTRTHAFAKVVREEKEARTEMQNMYASDVGFRHLGCSKKIVGFSRKILRFSRIS